VSQAWNFNNVGVSSDASGAIDKLLQLLDTGVTDDSGNRIVARDGMLALRVTRVGSSIDIAVSAPYPQVYPAIAGGLMGLDVRGILIAGDVAEVTVAGLPFRPKISLK
jgi:hypothetical protein